MPGNLPCRPALKMLAQSNASKVRHGQIAGAILARQLDVFFGLPRSSER